jgi:hypothetical protein
MSLPPNEVEADNQRRKMEGISKSPVGGVIGEMITVARPALAFGSALVASGTNSSTGLVIAGGVVGGLGIVDWFRKLGSSKVNENLESLGQATEDALKRVEDNLREYGTTIDEIKARIESDEFKDGMASAALQALRTTNKNRLDRMALLLANGVKEDDLEPETLDDMIRAATELKDHDISVLKTLSETQCKTGTYYPLTSVDGTMNRPREVWQALEQNKFITLDNQMEIRSSLERLKALGFCAEIQTTDSNWHPRVLVTPLGEKFLLRLQEIVV